MRRSILLISALLFAGMAFSQRSALIQNHLLWKISGNGLEKPSYIFGSMHYLCGEDVQLPPGLEDAINSTGNLYFEYDPQNRYELRKLYRAGKLKGKKLKDFYSTEQYDSIVDFFRKNLGFLEKDIRKKDPTYLSTTFYQLIYPCKKQQGIDEKILAYGNRKGFRISGIEKAKHRLQSLDSIAVELRAEQLLNTIRQFPAYRNKLLENRRLYITQHNSLYVSGLQFNTSHQDLIYLHLIQNRNLVWQQSVEKAMQKKPGFFNVGYMHLPGSHGLVNLFRHKGYTVEPVSISLEP